MQLRAAVGRVEPERAQRSRCRFARPVRLDARACGVVVGSSPGARVRRRDAAADGRGPAPRHPGVRPAAGRAHRRRRAVHRREGLRVGVSGCLRGRSARARRSGARPRVAGSSDRRPSSARGVARSPRRTRRFRRPASSVPSSRRPVRDGGRRCSRWAAPRVETARSFSRLASPPTATRPRARVFPRTGPAEESHEHPARVLRTRSSLARPAATGGHSAHRRGRRVTRSGDCAASGDSLPRPRARRHRRLSDERRPLRHERRRRATSLHRPCLHLEREAAPGTRGNGATPIRPIHPPR